MKHTWGVTLDVSPATYSCTCGFHGTREAVEQHIAAPPSTTCPECGVDDSVTWRREEEKFPYGVPVGFGVIYGVEPEIVELTAIVDKGVCAVCKFEFTDRRAEDARDAAVKQHLGAKP